MNEKPTPRPELLVQFEGGWNAGRCYNKQKFLVKVANRAIDKAFIDALEKLGVIGYGQELDWRPLPSETVVHGIYTSTYAVAEVIRGCDSSD